MAELAALPPSRLAHAVGKANSQRLLALAAGQEIRPVAGRAAEKSIGSERTFDEDVSSHRIGAVRQIGCEEVSAACDVRS